jgi:hypothetical protein
MREPGIYWIGNLNFIGEWEPARWTGKAWIVLGDEAPWTDEDFYSVHAEIGARIYIPEGAVLSARRTS